MRTVQTLQPPTAMFRGSRAGVAPAVDCPAFFEGVLKRFTTGRWQIMNLVRSASPCLEEALMRNGKPGRPHRPAGATPTPLVGEERRLRMESHHDGDETKGSVNLFMRDYIEAREASRSVRTAGRKDLTVTEDCPGR